MELIIWVTFIILALTISIITTILPYPNNMIPSLAAGLLWVIVSVSSALVEVNVVYEGTGYDYSREFTYTPLILLFGGIGLLHFMYAGYLMLSNQPTRSWRDGSIITEES